MQLSIENINKQYNAKTFGLRDVSLELGPGVTANPQPTISLALTVGLLAIAVLGRQRQLEHR